MVKADIIKKIKSFIPTFDKKVGIFEYGENNYYPETIQYLAENSVTASTCANILGQFIVGKGFGDADKFIVNKEKGLTLLKVGSTTAKSLAINRGVYVHFNYNLTNGKYSSVSILPYSHCRVGKKDDNKYHGKIGVSENWQDTKNYPVTWIDVYNPSLVSEQFIKQGKDYKGQVLYLNLDDFKYYANSTIHAVQNDCRSEIAASSFKSNSLDSEFFGKQLIITKPFYDDLLPPDSDEVIEGKKSEVSFEKTMQEFVGADSTKRILHLKMDFDNSKDIDKQIVFKNIESNIDDKLFAYTEKSAGDNIMVAFYNFPSILMRPDSGLFGNSGAAIKEAKQFYQDQTTDIRAAFNELIDLIMSNFDEFNGVVEHKLLIEEVEEDTEGAREEAQARLKGSVGGVQGILQIQQSYSEGKTDRESAITILVEIYGFNEQIANDLLGQPEPDKNDGITDK